MWFDCVVGETGEPGRHFRANLAQQHLPPSFARDRLGTAGRRRWQGEIRREGGWPYSGARRALLKCCVCMRFLLLSRNGYFLITVNLHILLHRFLFKSSHSKCAMTRTGVKVVVNGLLSSVPHWGRGGVGRACGSSTLLCVEVNAEDHFITVKSKFAAELIKSSFCYFGEDAGSSC